MTHPLVPHDPRAPNRPLSCSALDNSNVQFYVRARVRARERMQLRFPKGGKEITHWAAETVAPDLRDRPIDIPCLLSDRLAGDELRQLCAATQSAPSAARALLAHVGAECPEMLQLALPKFSLDF